LLPSIDRCCLAADVVRPRAVKARYTADIAALCDDYLAEKAAKAVTEQARVAARTALETYRDGVFPAYQTAINLYLQKFGAGFQVAAANTRGGPTCTYSVVINNVPVPVAGGTPAPGTPSFRNTLSAGDRNTLALAFFFATLDQDPDLADKVVVIDDPITSLDNHRSLTTVQEMRRLATKAGQLIVLSHPKAFLCTIWERADTSLRSAMEITRDGTGSTIRACVVHHDCITGHDRRHALLRDYLESSSADSRQVAEAIRPVLEAFVRVAYPEHFAPGDMLGKFVNLSRQRIGTPQQILDGPRTQELDDLLEYANKFHHDTNRAWETEVINDGQLVDLVKRALAFAMTSRLFSWTMLSLSDHDKCLWNATRPSMLYSNWMGRCWSSIRKPGTGSGLWSGACR